MSLHDPFEQEFLNELRSSTDRGIQKALVINCSAPHYNLGAHKCADWLRSQGYQVVYTDGDPGLWELDAQLVALSVIFSWHAPLARETACALAYRGKL